MFSARWVRFLTRPTSLPASISVVRPDSFFDKAAELHNDFSQVRIDFTLVSGLSLASRKTSTGRGTAVSIVSV